MGFLSVISRAFLVRAYPLQTHEMLFDAHWHAFRVFGGVPGRGIYDNIKTAVDRVSPPPRSAMNRASAANFVLRARAANFEYFRCGLFPAICRTEHERPQPGCLRGRRTQNGTIYNTVARSTVDNVSAALTAELNELSDTLV